ncbi:FeoB-associated Cys-rich membrane protein [Oscillibacter sp.]|nr:FeoB-associated Cys-rich membrane protein [Oscillibacter sp.]MBS6353701.1 FeoB-associated Cys-rich membrane protein [Oscillibacter sp.]
MLEVLILAALGVWLALALRSCLRRRGKGCGGCDGCCDRCGGACRADDRR